VERAGGTSSHSGGADIADARAPSAAKKGRVFAPCALAPPTHPHPAPRHRVCPEHPEQLAPHPVLMAASSAPRARVGRGRRRWRAHRAAPGASRRMTSPSRMRASARFRRFRVTCIAAGTLPTRPTYAVGDQRHLEALSWRTPSVGSFVQFRHALRPAGPWKGSLRRTPCEPVGADASAGPPAHRRLTRRLDDPGSDRPPRF